MDAFSAILPLPFRIFTLLILGIYCWGAALQLLATHGINALSLIRFFPPTDHHPPTPHTTSLTYRLATVLAAPLAILLLIFWAGARFDAARAPAWSTPANLYIIALIAIIALQPGPAQTGTRRALRTLARVLRGGLARDPAIKFGDVLMSDALVSYSKVFGDVALVACMAITSSSTAMPRRDCGGFLLLPLATSYPTFVRMAQTLTEYARAASPAAGRAPLANCAKYATNLPVIWLGAYINSFAGAGADDESAPHPAAGLVSAWWLAVALNSCYSFYWDVAMDWDLTLPADAVKAASCKPTPSTRPFGLRADLRLGGESSAVGYYAAMGADFVLRFTWGLKFSPRLDRLARLEGGLFLFEVLEVLRRAMWCVLRVEAQEVREDGAARFEGEVELE